MKRTFSLFALVLLLAVGILPDLPITSAGVPQSTVILHRIALLQESIPASTPPTVPYPTMVYDPDRQTSVAFTGGSTWEYDGSGWSLISTTNVPPWRYGHVMAYDSARGVSIVASGSAGSYGLYDTWEYDGIDWSLITPTSPLLYARFRAAAVYDSASGETVLFGGMWGGPWGDAYYGDTWGYDGTTWTLLTPAVSPPARASHTMTYDEARGVVVLFGGIGENSFLTDTWEFTNSTWVSITPALTPPPRRDAAMAYDSARGVAVVFGGHGSGENNLLADTWEYDGADWHLVTPTISPPARYGHAMAYDRNRGVVVLYGGRNAGGSLNDTWEYDGQTWVRVPPLYETFLPLAFKDAQGLGPSWVGPAAPEGRGISQLGCSSRPPEAGTFYILPIIDHIGEHGCRDFASLCCGCNGLACKWWQCCGCASEAGCTPEHCIDGQGPDNEDIYWIMDMRRRLGTGHSNVRIGYSDAIRYTRDTIAGADYEFDETALRYTLAVAAVTDTPILIHLNGQQWSGPGPLTEYLMSKRENVMHDHEGDPWYLPGRGQEISESDVDTTMHFLYSTGGGNYWGNYENRWYKERNLKEAISWLLNFRAGAKGYLLVGVSTDSEIAMSSLFAAHPEWQAGHNYNWKNKPLAFDYFDYDRIGATDFTGGLRHQFVDWAYAEYGDDLPRFNADMGTNFQKWWADPKNPSEHLGDGISVQNNPPTPDANGNFPSTDYVEYWTRFREQAVKQWVQLVVNWITCNSVDAPGYHLHDCASPFPTADIFTHQLTDVPDAVRDPYYYCSPISTAQVDNAQVGLTVYGPKAANKDKYPGDPPPPQYIGYFEEVRDLAAQQEDRWGFFEWNTMTWEEYDPGYDFHYQALVDLYNCGASIICPYAWPDAGVGDRGRRYATRDTQLETAIHDFVIAYAPVLYHHYLPLVPKSFPPARRPPPTPAPYPPPPTVTPVPGPTPTPTPPQDVTPPVTRHELEGDQGRLGWYISPVQVTLIAKDDMSGVDRTLYRITSPAWLEYGGPFVIAGEGYSTLNYRSVDRAGNWERIHIHTLKLDLTPPEVNIIEPSAPIYTLGMSFTLAFAASDRTSGLDALAATLDGAAVENGQEMDCLWLGPGPHTLIVTATDYAGLSASALRTFTVTATISDVAAAKHRLYEEGHIYGPGAAGIVASLDAKLEAAQAALDRGQAGTALNILYAFIHEVEAQIDQHITPEGGRALILAVQYITDRLGGTIALSPTVGGRLTGEGGRAVLTFSPGAVESLTVVTYTQPLGLLEAGDLVPLGKAFLLEAREYGGGAGVPAFTVPGTLRRYYTPAEVRDILVPSLRLYRWDGEKWQVVPNSGVSPALLQVWGEVQPFAIYRVWGLRAWPVMYFR